MRKLILAAGAVLTLAACGGGDDTTTNTMTTDTNMMVEDNMMMDANAMNGTMMDGNMAVDPATQNMMAEDMNTNAPDTNLANGM
jgi:hypothetical protein